MHICIFCKLFGICIGIGILRLICICSWKCKCRCIGKSTYCIHVRVFELSLTDVPNQYPQVPAVQVFVDGQLAISSPLKGGEHVPLEAQASSVSEPWAKTMNAVLWLDPIKPTGGCPFAPIIGQLEKWNFAATSIPLSHAVVLAKMNEEKSKFLHDSWHFPAHACWCLLTTILLCPTRGRCTFWPCCAGDHRGKLQLQPCVRNMRVET